MKTFESLARVFMFFFIWHALLFTGALTALMALMHIRVDTERMRMIILGLAILPAALLTALDWLLRKRKK